MEESHVKDEKSSKIKSEKNILWRYLGLLQRTSDDPCWLSWFFKRNDLEPKTVRDLLVPF